MSAWQSQQHSPSYQQPWQPSQQSRSSWQDPRLTNQNSPSSDSTLAHTHFSESQAYNLPKAPATSTWGVRFYPEQTSVTSSTCQWFGKQCLAGASRQRPVMPGSAGPSAVGPSTRPRTSFWTTVDIRHEPAVPCTIAVSITYPACDHARPSRHSCPSSAAIGRTLANTTKPNAVGATATIASLSLE